MRLDLELADDPESPQRDRPLTFHWRAPPDWIGRLRLAPARSRRHEAARESILLEAVLAEIGGWPAVSYSRRREFYAGQRRYFGTAFTFSTVVPAVDELTARSLLNNTVAASGIASGIQSTFRATPLLLAAVPADLVVQAEHIVGELIRLRDHAHHLVDYRDTDRTVKMRRALSDMNEAIGGIRVDLDAPGIRNAGGVVLLDGGAALYPAMRSVYRVFNGDWHHGGRLYGHWTQQAPKEIRALLRIGGEPVIELDHQQLHPRLLYQLAERALDGDAYTLTGWDRKLCKRAFNILLNAPTYQEALGAIASRIGEPNARSQAARLIADVKARHAAVARFFHSGVGLLLQAVDADMAEAVLIRLLRQGVVALPIHDSFIVARRHEGTLREAMEASFSLVSRLNEIHTPLQRVA